MIDEGIVYLSNTKFPGLLMETFHKKMGEVDIIKVSLHCLGNYVYKDLSVNIKSIDFEILLNLLIQIQKKYYSNADILISINLVAGYLIKIYKETSAKEKLYFLISESIKIQDFMISLIIMTLKLIYEVLILFPVLVDEVFDLTMHCIFNILRNHTNPEIVNLSYKILVLFARNFIYAYTMVSNGLIELIKNTLESELDPKVKFPLRELLFQFLGILSVDTKNAKKISDVLMNKLLVDVVREDYSSNQADMIKLFFNLTRHNICVEPFVQYNGIDTILEILEKSSDNVSVIYDCFNILSNIIDGNDEYKRIMQKKQVPDLINKIIARSAYLDKKIEFEGRSKYKN
jgi:hypothetical protein